MSRLVEIGFWCTPHLPPSEDYPDPAALLAAQESSPLHPPSLSSDVLYNYLTSPSHAVLHSIELSPSYCRLCPPPSPLLPGDFPPPTFHMGCANLTDGIYMWPEGLAHYVLVHGLRTFSQPIRGTSAEAAAAPPLPASSRQQLRCAFLQHVAAQTADCCGSCLHPAIPQPSSLRSGASSSAAARSPSPSSLGDAASVGGPAAPPSLPCSPTRGCPGSFWWSPPSPSLPSSPQRRALSSSSDSRSSGRLVDVLREWSPCCPFFCTRRESSHDDAPLWSAFEEDGVGVGRAREAEKAVKERIEECTTLGVAWRDGEGLGSRKDVARRFGVGMWNESSKSTIKMPSNGV